MAKGKSSKKGESLSARYYAVSRTLAANYVFIVPFFALYQIALAYDAGVRSGTVPILGELFDRISRVEMLVLNLALLVSLLLAIWYTRAKRRYVKGMYGLMFLEAAAWSAFMMGIALLLHPWPSFDLRLSLPSWARDVIAYAGAGLYEEILFRFLLMGGLILILQRGLGGNLMWVVPLACFASAVIFSWAHHALGGQPFDWYVFGYRIIMGLILGTAFWLRGLGIAVYAHALYNVWIVVDFHVRHGYWN